MVARCSWHWIQQLANVGQRVHRLSSARQPYEVKPAGLAQVDLELHSGHSILPVDLPQLQSPLLLPVSVTCTVDACLECNLAAHSSFVDGVVDSVRHLGRSPATEVLAMFVDNASVVVWGRLLMGFPQLDLVLHRSSANALGHAHGGDIARSRSY